MTPTPCSPVIVPPRRDGLRVDPVHRPLEDAPLAPSSLRGGAARGRSRRPRGRSRRARAPPPRRSAGRPRTRATSSERGTATSISTETPTSWIASAMPRRTSQSVRRFASSVARATSSAPASRRISPARVTSRSTSLVRGAVEVEEEPRLGPGERHADPFLPRRDLDARAVDHLAGRREEAAPVDLEDRARRRLERGEGREERGPRGRLRDEPEPRRRDDGERPLAPDEERRQVVARHVLPGLAAGHGDAAVREDGLETQHPLPRHAVLGGVRAPRVLGDVAADAGTSRAKRGRAGNRARPPPPPPAASASRPPPPRRRRSSPRRSPGSRSGARATGRRRRGRRGRRPTFRSGRPAASPGYAARGRTRGGAKPPPSSPASRPPRERGRGRASSPSRRPRGPPRRRGRAARRRRAASAESSSGASSRRAMTGDLKIGAGRRDAAEKKRPTRRAPR